MTIAAINAVVADVMLVAELDGLFAGDVLIGQVGSTGEAHHAAEGECREQRAKKDTEP